MKYELEELQEANIFSLRNVAREMGVKAPTVLKKKELIDEIIKIQNGEKQPCAPTKKGQPVKKDLEIRNVENRKTVVEPSAIDVEKNIKKEFIDSILKEIEKKLNQLL